MSAKWGLCTSPQPCPPARRPSWVCTHSGFPHACLTNPRVFTFAHNLRWICLLSIFSTHCPSERWPFRPPSDFRLPELEPGHASAPGALLGGSSAAVGGSFPLFTGRPLGGALVLPSAQVPGLHPELAHWGCVCPGLLPGWQPQSQESRLLVPTNALPRPGLTPRRSPRNRGEWSPNPDVHSSASAADRWLPPFPVKRWVFAFPARLYQKPQPFLVRHREAE